MAQLIILFVIALSVQIMARPGNRPTYPDNSDPSPQAESGNSQGNDGRPNTAAEETITQAPMQNSGIIVNGFDCTNYINQCQEGTKSLNMSDTSTRSEMVANNPRANPICENTQAQTVCANITNSPVTNNMNNVTIIQQQQTNHNLININNKPFDPSTIPIFGQFPGMPKPKPRDSEPDSAQGNVSTGEINESSNPPHP